MKFIHLADVHLGDKFDITSSLSKRVRGLSWKSLSNILNANKDVDFALIAGDLFERSYFSSKDFKRLFEIFESFGKDIYYVSGNHDYFDGYTDIFFANGPANLHVFPSDRLGVYEDNSTRIYGISYRDRVFNQEVDLGIDLDKNFFNILLIHSDVGREGSKYCNLNEEDIISSDFNYIALGHIHKAQAIAKAFYPGSIEPHSFTDTNNYGYIRYDDGKVSFVDSSITKFVDMKVNLSDFSSAKDLLAFVNNKLSEDKKNFLRLTISLMEDIDLGQLKKYIDADFVEIIKKEDLDFDKIISLYPNSLLSKYYDKFKGKTSEKDKLARDMGLDAILRSRND